MGAARVLFSGHEAVFLLFTGYLGLYIFYVLTVVVSTWLHKRHRRERLIPSSPAEPGKRMKHLDAVH